MWSNNDHQIVILPPAKGFSTPSPASSNHFKALRSSVPSGPMSETKRRPSPASRGDLFHVIHKVPAGNSPYVRAKHVQLIEKDPSRAISLFWSAINAGDKVDSALKDMAIVMKQLNRCDEAIEAVKSFRHLCPHDSQESLDNVLVELYKRAGRIEEEVEMLQNKLKRIEGGVGFGGRRTKTARSQGKKVHITIEEEKSRILGNLAWAYLQQHNYRFAEEYYRRALVLEPDKNKECNLAICLMCMNRMAEAKSLLNAVKASSGRNLMDESYAKSYDRACEMLNKLEAESALEPCLKERNSSKETRSSLSPKVAARRREGGQRDDTYRDIGQPREFRCVNQFEAKDKSNDKMTVLEEMGSPCVLDERGNSLRYSQQGVMVNELRNGCFDEISGERRSGYFRAGMNGPEPQANYWHRKTYYSPMPAWCKTRTPFTQPRRCLWGFSDGRQRKMEFSNRERRFSCNEDWRRRRSWDKSDRKEFTSEESNLDQEELTPGSQNNQSTTDTPNPTADSSICCKKKSWADMAEEEEENEDFFTSSDKFEFSESPCVQTQMKNGDQNFEYYNGWNTEEEFSNENLNSNTLQDSPYLQTQMKNVARNVEHLNVRDEFVSPRSQPVKRTLCFDNHQKQRGHLTDYNNLCASPVPRKSPNRDSSNSAQQKGKGCVPGKNVRLLRRNRLKVFEDITRSP